MKILIIGGTMRRLLGPMTTSYTKTMWPHDMPFYLPESNKKFRNFLTMDIYKALAKGLTFRSLSETIRDTLNWRKT